MRFLFFILAPFFLFLLIPLIVIALFFTWLLLLWPLFILIKVLVFGKAFRSEIGLFSGYPGKRKRERDHSIRDKNKGKSVIKLKKRMWYINGDIKRWEKRKSLLSISWDSRAGGTSKKKYPN